jgi:Zn-dependent M16 (insulinase) family peptidase
VGAIRSFSKNRGPAELKTLAADLNLLGRSIFKPGNAVMAAIGDEAQVELAIGRIEASDTLAVFQRPLQTPDLSALDLAFDQQVPYEGWSTSTAVSFVARTFQTVALGHPDAPLLAVLSKLLRSLYLHREIREKGGAYGGFAIYNPESGLFSLASYRDPHIVRTLGVFDGTAKFLQESRLKQDDIKEAVLQVCSEIDKPDPPGPASRKAFSRLIVGLTDEARKHFKQQLLETTPQKLVDSAQRYFGRRDLEWGTAVIAGEDQLEKANAQLTGKPLKLNTI